MQHGTAYAEVLDMRHGDFHDMEAAFAEKILNITTFIGSTVPPELK